MDMIISQISPELPTGWILAGTDLTSSTRAGRLDRLGHHLWRALVDEPTGRRLTELIDSSLASVLDLVVHRPNR